MDYASIAFGLVKAAIAIYQAATGPSEEVVKALNGALEAMEKAQADRKANHERRVKELQDLLGGPTLTKITDKIDLSKVLIDALRGQ